MIPSIVLFIPYYLLFRQADLLDNVGALALIRPREWLIGKTTSCRRVCSPARASNH
jgi:hypothetical protein